jgi:arsenite methyltransferase
MTDDTNVPDSDDGGVGAAERRHTVRDRYGEIATSKASCCGETSGSACCGGDTRGETDHDDRSRLLGYSDAELDEVESGANLGLGCGTPTAIAGLERGEVVLDLGSGAGFDCFLAARKVGSEGRVTGVDMTPEMVEKARENAATDDAENVSFRLGEIEHLPVADGAVDVIISNCVINLSPDKQRVFDEAFRVLRPGGRLAISDVVQTAPLPAAVRTNPSSVAGCVAGAAPIPELESMLEDAGGVDVSIDPKGDSEEFIREWDDERDVSEYIVSATIEGRKPDR